MTATATAAATAAASFDTARGRPVGGLALRLALEGAGITDLLDASRCSNHATSSSTPAEGEYCSGRRFISRIPSRSKRRLFSIKLSGVRMRRERERQQSKIIATHFRWCDAGGQLREFGGRRPAAARRLAGRSRSRRRVFCVFGRADQFENATDTAIFV